MTFIWKIVIFCNFLAFFDTKSCLDPTYHTLLRSVSIDGRLDTHEGGFGEVQFSMTPTVPRKLEVPRAKWQMEAEVI